MMTATSLLPGGAINADGLRMNEKVQKWTNDFLNSNRLLAAICRAPWLLVSADNLEGRRLASYWTIQDDIQNAGGEWVDAAVVIDGNLITSLQPDDLVAFNQSIIKLLSHKTYIASAHAADLATISIPNQIEDVIRFRGLGYIQDMDGINDKASIDILADNDTFYPSNTKTGR